MAGIYGYNSISTLFSGLNTSSVTSGIYNSLSELSSIRSGSYYKIAKKYYGSSQADTASSDTAVKQRTSRMDYDYKNGDYKVNLDNSSSTSTSKDTVSTIAGVEKSAKDLKSAADKLVQSGSESVFKQTAGKYDTDKIYDAVNNFASAYNDVITKASASDSSSIENAAKSMKNATAVNAKALSKIGITIGSDNKLSVDEKTFKAADMNSVKSLFNGNGSFGYQTEVKASMIDSAASLEAGRSNTYTGRGSYSYNFNAGNLFNQSI